MFAGELLEIFGQNTNRQICNRSILLLIQLDQQTFFQVTGTYPGRLKILDDIQDRLDLLLIYLLSGLEDQIVRYRRKVPSQITVIIDISNDILRYFHLLIR